MVFLLFDITPDLNLKVLEKLQPQIQNCTQKKLARRKVLKNIKSPDLTGKAN